MAPTTATNNYYQYKGPGRLCSSSNKFEIRGAPTASVFRRPPALRCLKADLSITKYKGSAGWSSAHCTSNPRSGHFPLLRRCRPLLGRRGPLVGPAPIAHAVGSLSRTSNPPRRGCAAPYPMGPSDGPRIHDVQRSRFQRLKSIVRCPMFSVQVVQCPVSNVQCPGAQGPVSITPPPPRQGPPPAGRWPSQLSRKQDPPSQVSIEGCHRTFRFVGPGYPQSLQALPSTTISPTSTKEDMIR